ncbi:hypothetical protein FGU65_14595 [Methanoculleus sp. FWC-SCC1]|uniref:Uncharacterized protein n=1 Tax=Methanoculleus frigidifontis TaxID=2584085 RepID=A0ABT8MDT0_9EURY|nr:hypothetical protein [Methanoculleus sp. FWC-SCC1]MDN7026095.1 hypothetical protein [Methanoculleus sp. FWC-SCC1]
MVSIPTGYRLAKIFALGQMACIFVLLITLVQAGSATGYELSIYDAYPWYFWAALIASVLLGVLLILWSGTRAQEMTWYWLLGLVPILLSYTIFLGLPLIRGYVLYGRGNNDILSHIGWSRTIVETGQLASNDFYPVVHILISVLDYIGLSLEQAAGFLAIFFSLVFIIFMLFLARAVSPCKGPLFFILAFSIPLLLSYFHLSVHPSILSVFMIPLLLGCYHLKGSAEPVPVLEFTFLALVLTLLTVFFHPVTALIALVIFAVFGITNLLVRRIGGRDALASEPGVRYFALVIILGLFTWLNPFEGLDWKMRAVLEGLVGESTGIASYYGGLAEQANLSLAGVAQIALNQYGQVLVYFIAAYIALVLVAGLIIKGKARRYEVYYAVQVLAAGLFSVVMVIGYFIEFEPVRVVRYAAVVIPVLCGYVFYHKFRVIRRPNTQVLFLGLIFFFIAAASIFGVFNVYFSPTIVKANAQLTQAELDGVVWYFDRADLATPLLATDLPLGRYEMYHFGYGTPEHFNRPQLDLYLPSHFGYDTNETLRASLDARRAVYLITTETNRQTHLVYPETVRPQVHQYTDPDFVRLSDDPTVDKSYTNGEFMAWYLYVAPAEPDAA